MNIKDLPRDIFGVTMYATKEARVKEFNRYYKQLANLGLLNLQVSFGTLLVCVIDGFVSPQSATYFLAGRASAYAVKIYECFNRFYEKFYDGKNDFKLSQKWFQENGVTVENIFLSPLEELDSKNDFESERSEYESVSYEQLSLI